jgi:hypothetical protein
LDTFHSGCSVSQLLCAECRSCSVSNSE